MSTDRAPRGWRIMRRDGEEWRPIGLPHHEGRITLTKQFEVGKTYACRSLSDYNCIYAFTILARTAKQVTVNVRGKIVKRGVRVYNGDALEHFKPFGTYSMCPIIYAGIRSIELAEMDRLANDVVEVEL